MYYCVIVAFCQHVFNEHAMLCYGTHFNIHGGVVAADRYPPGSRDLWVAVAEFGLRSNQPAQGRTSSSNRPWL